MPDSSYTVQIERLPTFFKHRDTNYFPTWAFVIPTSLTRLPASAVEALVYTLITYFAVPLSIDAGRCAPTAAVHCPVLATQHAGT